MENDWIITPVSVWQEVECRIEWLTASTSTLQREISRIKGPITRSKTKRLNIYENQLAFDLKRLQWYTEERERIINRTKIILDQLLDFGCGCPTIELPFTYTSAEFCKLLTYCRPIAEQAYDLRMSGVRCSLFY